jgi:TPR repeat protein
MATTDEAQKRSPNRESLAMHQRPCEGGYLIACYNMSVAYQAGIGGEVSFGKAVELAKKACGPAAPSACMNLGTWYMVGDVGLAKDYAKAREYAEKGCNDEATAACHLLGELFAFGNGGVQRDPKKAFELALRGCQGEQSQGNGCNAVANCYERGIGVPRSSGDAAAYRKKACDQGHEYSCSKLK